MLILMARACIDTRDVYQNAILDWCSPSIWEMDGDASSGGFDPP